MQDLTKIAPVIGTDVENFKRLSDNETQQILIRLLSYACLAQNTGNITSARLILAEFPYELLISRLPGAIEAYLNCNDEWEFRRLIELLRIVAQELIDRYLAMGERSPNPEVREAAEDLAYFSQDAKSKAFLFQLSDTRQHGNGVAILPGIPQAIVRNRIVGKLRPGAILEIDCEDGHRREFLLEAFCLDVPVDGLNSEEERNVPLILVIRCETPSLLRRWGEVFMKL